MRNAARNERQCFMLSRAVVEGITSEEIEATWADMVELGIAHPPVDRFDIQMSAATFVLLCDRGIGILDKQLAKVRTELDELHKLKADREQTTLEALSDVKQRLALDQNATAILDKIKTAEDVDRLCEEKDPDDPAFEGKWVTLGYRIAGEELAAPTFHVWTTSRRRLRGSDATQQTRNRYVFAHDPERFAYCALIVLLATRNAIKETKISKAALRGIGGRHAYTHTTTITLGVVEAHDGGESTGRTVRPHLRRGHIRRQHYGPGNEFVKKIFVEPVFVNAADGVVPHRRAYNVTKGA